MLDLVFLSFAMEFHFNCVKKQNTTKKQKQKPFNALKEVLKLIISIHLEGFNESKCLMEFNLLCFSSSFKVG